MTTQKNLEKVSKISDAEWKVMHILWNRGRLSSNEVVAEIVPATGWSPNKNDKEHHDNHRDDFKRGEKTTRLTRGNQGTTGSLVRSGEISDPVNLAFFTFSPILLLTVLRM